MTIENNDFPELVNGEGNKLEKWQELVLFKLYPGYDKIHGPYNAKGSSDRLILTMYNTHLPKIDKRKTRTCVFARAVAESYLGEILPQSITVDHIDRNFFNNSPENLALLDRGTHAENDVLNVRIKPINCPLCSTVFEPTSKQAYPQLDREGKPGPFCPTCVRTNAYANYINKGGVPIPRVKLEREYYRQKKEYKDETLVNIVLQKMAKKGFNKFVIPDITSFKYKCKVCGTSMKQPQVYCSYSCKDVDLKCVEEKGTRYDKRPTKDNLTDLLKKFTMTKIADLLGVNQVTVKMWARAYGIEYDHHQVKHNGRSVKPSLDIIKGLMKAGYNYNQIGKALDISRNIIENTVRRKNLREEVFGHDRTKWPINNWQGGDMTAMDTILSELQQKHNK